MLIHGVAWGRMTKLNIIGPIYSCLEASSGNTPSTEGLFAACRASSVSLSYLSSDRNHSKAGQHKSEQKPPGFSLLPYPLLFPSFSYWCWTGETSAGMGTSSPATPFHRLWKSFALHQPSTCNSLQRKRWTQPLLWLDSALLQTICTSDNFQNSATS